MPLAREGGALVARLLLLMNCIAFPYIQHYFSYVHVKLMAMPADQTHVWTLCVNAVISRQRLQASYTEASVNRG